MTLKEYLSELNELTGKTLRGLAAEKKKFRKSVAKGLARIQNNGGRAHCPDCGGTQVTGYWSNKGPKFKCRTCRTAFLPHVDHLDFAAHRLLHCPECGPGDEKGGELTLMCTIKNDSPVISCTCGHKTDWNSLM